MGSLVEKITDAEAERMIREVDTDLDGSISFEEFAKMIMPAPK